MLRCVGLALIVLPPIGCADRPAPRSPGARPAATPDITVALCSPDEPGRRLVFSGRVLDSQGLPFAKAAVIAWGTDENGLYVPRGSQSRVPRLRGTAVTGEDGRFRFMTVWPGAYPSATEPAHIHVGVMAHEHQMRYITFWFEGDPLLTEQRRKVAGQNPEVKIVKPVQGRDGEWQFEYDVRLEHS